MWQGILGWLRPADRSAAARDGAHRYDDPAGSDPGGVAAEAVLSTDFAESELLDFLAGDVDPVRADPVFREQLRDELWRLVQDGAARAKNH
jgi:hypothetical protein